MRSAKLLAFATCFVPGVAMATINVQMNAFDDIQRVQIQVGIAPCGLANKLFFDGEMKKGYDSKPIDGTGTNGLAVCWRRADPVTQNFNFTPWTRCTDDGVCNIQ